VNRSELLQQLKEAKINPNTYSLEGGSPSETYVLSDEGYGKWAVYYSERGERNGEKIFRSESEACEELYRWIMKDPTTRWVPKP
jgi:hypothetical protein